MFLSNLLQKPGPFLGKQQRRGRRGWRACGVRGYLAAAQPCPQLLHVLRGLLPLGVAQMSLLLQGPFPLLEAEVVLGDLHDPLYQLGGGQRGRCLRAACPVRQWLQNGSTDSASVGQEEGPQLALKDTLLRNRRSVLSL